jgi:hypothetical protein
MRLRSQTEWELKWLQTEKKRCQFQDNINEEIVHLWAKKNSD